MIKLEERHGKLYIPLDAIHDPLMKDYFKPDHFCPEGGCVVMVKYGPGEGDTLPWPIPTEGYWTKTENKWQEALAHALYDDRETGVLPPYERSVFLPNGYGFDIDNAKIYCPWCEAESPAPHAEDCIWEDKQP